MENALSKQVKGSYYKNMPIQVVEFCYKNKIPYMEGNIIKYACRWDKKGEPITDLDKIIHYAQLLKQMYQEENQNIKDVLLTNEKKYVEKFERVS